MTVSASLSPFMVAGLGRYVDVCQEFVCGAAVNMTICSMVHIVQVKPDSFIRVCDLLQMHE
jgi:hypothetical protein